MHKLRILILFASIFFIVPCSSDAQNLNVGIKGGVTGYQITNDVGGTKGTSGRTIAIEAGFLAEIPIGKVFSIQPEAVYVQKGGEESDQGLGTSSITLNYVDIPVLFKFEAPMDDSMQPFIIGGPYAGYLIEASSRSGGGSEEISDLLHKFHYGFKVGLGLNLGSVLIDARYDMGLANIYKKDEDLEGADNSLKITTAGIVLSLGIVF